VALTGREHESQLSRTEGLGEEKCDEKSLSRSSVRSGGMNSGAIPTREIPVMSFATEGFATARPAAALVTETAGVSTPSAIVNPVAKRHFEWSCYSR